MEGSPFPLRSGLFRRFRRHSRRRFLRRSRRPRVSPKRPSRGFDGPAQCCADAHNGRKKFRVPGKSGSGYPSPGHFSFPPGSTSSVWDHLKSLNRRESIVQMRNTFRFGESPRPQSRNALGRMTYTACAPSSRPPTEEKFPAFGCWHFRFLRASLKTRFGAKSASGPSANTEEHHEPSEHHADLREAL